jgi:hypothetical protein
MCNIYNGIMCTILPSIEMPVQKESNNLMKPIKLHYSFDPEIHLQKIKKIQFLIKEKRPTLFTKSKLVNSVWGINGCSFRWSFEFVSVQAGGTHYNRFDFNVYLCIGYIVFSNRRAVPNL